MAQILRLPPPFGRITRHHRRNPAVHTSSNNSWTSLSHSLNCNGRFSCLFSDNRKQSETFGPEWKSLEPYSIISLIKGVNSTDTEYCLQEQVRKALDGALGGKKIEFDKWNEEIKRREEAGGGGNSGGGGWFRWGRWFGGSDDHFWQEAQQASLAILGILVLYLIVAKGDVMLAVVFNPLLFSLRGTRSALTFLTSKITNRNGENLGTAREEVAVSVSVKDRVVGKWGDP